MTRSYLDIARTVYAEKGVRFSLADVAEAANVSRPTIYKHLGNKDKILSLLEGNSEVDTHARILRGVLDVAQAQGFKAATIEAIAEAAGVGPATIYRRFGDKEGLIRAFIKQHTPRDKMPDFPPDAKGDFAAALAVIATHMLGFMSEHKTLVRLIFSGNEADRAYLKALRDDTNSTFNRLNAFFQLHQRAGQISHAVSSTLLTTNLFGMIHAQAVLAPAGEALDIEAASASICQLFLSLSTGAE
ncbi:MAG TPA: TetR/AcrR family transcriptional regulator [Rhodobacteraceae bacterium]|nr:TetR/AcrR family transcriptional regulator [Paracoccaceae bacterium]